MLHDAAEEVAATLGQAQFAAVIGEGVDLALEVPDRDVGMAARSGQALERLGHEGCAQAVFFRHRFQHELEEAELVGRRKHVVVLPVHLELAGRILVV